MLHLIYKIALNHMKYNDGLKCHNSLSLATSHSFCLFIISSKPKSDLLILCVNKMAFSLNALIIATAIAMKQEV